MCIELVYDKDPVSRWITLDGLLNVVFKIHFCACFSDTGTDDLPGSHFKVGDQALGAMAFVFELLIFDQARFHRQRLIHPLFGLNAGLFITAYQMGALLMKRKSDMIQPADRFTLLVERFLIQIRRTLPIAHQVRL